MTPLGWRLLYFEVEFGKVEFGGPSVSMMQKVVAIVLLPFKLHGILTVPRCLILEPPYATRTMTFDWFSVFVCRWRPYSDDTCTDIFKGYFD